MDLVVSHNNICHVRKDDIWILSYPKCGTTWAIETVWMLMNDVKIETANSPQMARVPYAANSFYHFLPDSYSYIGTHMDMFLGG